MKPKWRKMIGLVSALSILALVGACKSNAPPQRLKAYPLDGLEGLIARDGVEFDPAVSADGKGSLKISGNDRAVRLFETGDLDLENLRVIYRAKLKAEGLTDKAYLEMWAHFPGKGEFFSRGLHNPVIGSADWTSVEAVFFLQKGENPDNLQLNLVVEGTGTVWIDDVTLDSGPLEP